MPTIETPRKTSDQIDRVIDRLNARWNLQIPRLHGVDAKAAANAADIQRKCSSRIRAVCWMNKINIDSVMEDFEERAVSMHSEWIFKPSQQRGTLPRLPVTKSSSKTLALSKSRYLTREQRQLLCEALLNLLEDEYRLANESDVYSRTSGLSNVEMPSNASTIASRHDSGRLRDISTSSASFHTSRDRSTTSKSIKSGSISSAGNSAEPKSSKKRMAATALPTPSKGSKRSKSMQSENKPSVPPKPVYSYFLPQKESSYTSNSTTSITSFPSNHVPTSFESAAPDQVFSQADRDEPSSNNTSILSDDDHQDTQFSGGTQIENAFNERDKALLDSFSKADAPHPVLHRPPTLTISEQLQNLVPKGTFQKTQPPFPKDFPYWYTYELCRVSKHFDMTEKELWQKVSSVCHNDLPSFDDFWRVVTALRNGHPQSKPLVRSHLADWTLKENLYRSPENGKSISLTAKLSYATSTDRPVFDFELNPIKQDPSCRFHRRFGADRFMVLDVPYFDQSSLPAPLRKLGEGEKFHDTVFEWLTKNDLNIAGRVWRAFWTEPNKSQSKRKRQDDGRRQKVHLFAIDGFDFVHTRPHATSGRHRACSLVDFLQWHIPIAANLNSTDLKLFSRMQLGLSKTEPTLALQPHEFIECPDIQAQNADGTTKTDDTVMTDGCGRISLPFARQVWQQLNKGGDLPTAFQARIGGAKGLWHVDYTGAHSEVSERGFWIEVRPSQLKIKPHPRHRLDADEFTRTFEVVKYSKPCSHGHLNTQFVTILENRKVPRSVIKNAVEAHLNEYFQPLDEAMTDEVATRLWRQLNHSSPSSRDEISFCGALPDGIEDEIDMMLEHGLIPSECSFLTTRIKDLVTSVLDSYRERLRIELEHSTTVFCIPDPLGVLLPGQIQMNFSHSIKHPVSGISEMQLEGMDVLVGRNPAYLASDMQRVHAVYHHELRHYRDVVIFPVKGEVPLADLLSGGDYDGDTVTVIWDQTFVSKFMNYPKPTLASKPFCGIESRNRFIRDIITAASPSEYEVTEFLSACCSFNGFPSLLGEVTATHEKIVYAESKNLCHEKVEVLAALANYLVDGSKQGDALKRSNWSTVRKRAEGRVIYRQPAYKVDDEGSARKGPNNECVNVIDYLYFNVITGLKNKILGKFHENWTSSPSTIDKDLTKLYNADRTRAEDRHHPEAQQLRAVLDDLVAKLRTVNEEWCLKCGERDRINGSSPPIDYAKLLEHFSGKVAAIEPLQMDCDVRREFLRDGGDKGTRWSLLKASALYYTFHRGSFAFKMVGDELCRMKSRSQGKKTWEMTLRMRNYVKADVKKTRRLSPDDDEDVFYDAEG